MDWATDVLAGFETAKFGDITLIRPDAPLASARAAVLHVHGYNDYFYQAELADWFRERGLEFYAVDMRRSGRSLKPGDHPHDMADISEQGDDIQAAVDAIRGLHPELPIVVHAHSTGGLAAAVWAADRAPEQLKAVILNSPLFGLQTSKVDRLKMRGLPLLHRLAPGSVVAKRPAIYAKYLHVDGGGPAQFDTAWKTPVGVPARARWVYAVTRAWARIETGLPIPVPTLVARSDSCGPETDDNPRINEQDVVVDTEATARAVPKLGPKARELVVTGGIHDLTQSAPGPRAAYFAAVEAFLDEALR